MNNDIGQTQRTLSEKGQLEIKDNHGSSLMNNYSNEHSRLCILKTEKLSSAIYLVSNLFSNEEPLKWTLRKTTTDLLKDISFIERDISTKGHFFVSEKLNGHINSIVSLLEVSWMGGLVSKMNFEILKLEYTKLKDLLNKKFFSQTSSLTNISNEFFLSDKIKEEEVRAERLERERLIFEERILSSIPENGELEYKKISSSNDYNDQNVYQNYLNNRDGFSGTVQKDTGMKKISYRNDSLNNKKDSDIRQTIDINNNLSFIKKDNLGGVLNIVNSLSDKNKNKRHEKILSSLRSGIYYTVPEILSLIGMGSELSEKTIQRDLIQLVSSGALKKTGERRWSRYSIPE